MRGFFAKFTQRWRGDAKQDRRPDAHAFRHRWKRKVYATRRTLVRSGMRSRLGSVMVRTPCAISAAIAA